MSDETTVVTQGTPWTSVRFFSSFDEAQTMRESLRKSDLTGTLQVKVKRCGEGGKMYVVKMRENAEMAAATASVEEDLGNKPPKKTRKPKK